MESEDKICLKLNILKNYGYKVFRNLNFKKCQEDEYPEWADVSEDVLKKKKKKNDYIYIFIKMIENFRLGASWKKNANEYPKVEGTFPVR